MTKPPYWDEAIRALAERDSVLEKLIAEYPGFHLTRRGDPFTTLARAIVGQQISVKAAQTIWDRLLKACGAGERGPLDPVRVHRKRVATLRGIGRWTAEMFLMFHEMRADVLPVADIGLQKAVALHYLDGRRPTLAELRAIAESWQPYRSVATWYLWRSLDPIPVEY